MNRPLLAIAGAVALAIAVSSCSTTNPDAATVNGVHIYRTAFEADMHTLANDAGYLKANEAAVAQGGLPIAGATPGSINAAFVGQQLSNLVLLQVVHTELTQRNIVPDADQIKNGEQVARGILTVPDAAAWALLPADLRTKYTQKGAEYLALEKDLGPKTDAELVPLFASVQDQLSLCVSHILVATLEDANAALDDIKGGKSFADVAAARSTDKGSNTNGGNLADPSTGQCPTAASLDADFVAGVRGAPLGVPTAPVKTQFGYHIILVDKPLPTVQSLHTELVAYGGQQALKTYISTNLKAANISVDPHYGTWDTAKGAIVPAAAKGTSTVKSAVTTVPAALDPSAVVPSSTP